MLSLVVNVRRNCVGTLTVPAQVCLIPVIFWITRLDGLYYMVFLPLTLALIQETVWIRLRTQYRVFLYFDYFQHCSTILKTSKLRDNI